MAHPDGMAEPRLTRAAESFFVDRRWWLFVPIPITFVTFVLYPGPYRIAGGYTTVYVAAGLIVASGLLLIVLPNRAAPWGPVALAVTCIGSGIVSAAVPKGWTIVLPYLLAAAAVRRYRTWPSIAVIVSAAGSILAIQITNHANLLSVVSSLAVMSALAMGSLARRSRADRLEQAELALAREQAAREEHARAAALAERTRIAREVHDVLAHSLSALSLNLQGARLMLAREGASEQAQDQVRRAQRLAVEGLAEARRAVAALREDPVPASRAIADLVTSSRLESGARTDFTVDGTPRDLPGPAEDALYRTAQEALSNTRKHAAGAPVDVRLAYGNGSTELIVTDHQGRRPAEPVTGGYGLTGMRERAEMIGGELRTGPTDDGWQVRLVVPA